MLLKLMEVFQALREYLLPPNKEDQEEIAVQDSNQSESSPESHLVVQCFHSSPTNIRCIIERKPYVSDPKKVPLRRTPACKSLPSLMSTFDRSISPPHYRRPRSYTDSFKNRAASPMFLKSPFDISSDEESPFFHFVDE